MTCMEEYSLISFIQEYSLISLHWLEDSEVLLCAFLLRQLYAVLIYEFFL